MNKKGFTLVEILGVITILTIVLIIAIPNISNIVSSNKEQAFKAEVGMIINTIEKKITLEPSYDLSYVEVGNIKEELGLNGSNFETISITKNAFTGFDVVIVGKNNWSGYVAYGNLNNFDVITIDEYNSGYSIEKGLVMFDTEHPYNDVYASNATASSDGGYYYNYKFGITGSIGCVINKYDAQNNLLWSRTDSNCWADYYDAVEVASGYVAAGYIGGVIVAPYVAKGGIQDAVITKYSLNGYFMWTKSFGGTNQDYFKDLVAVADGYVAVGASNSTDGDMTGIAKGGYDGIIVKYDLNGNVVWKKNYGGTAADIFRGIISVADGYIAVGESYSTNGDLTGQNKGGYDGIIVKYDLSGNLVWEKNVGGALSDELWGIASITGGYVVVGQSQSIDSDFAGVTAYGSEDAIMIKYDNSNNIVWKKRFGGTKTEVFYNVDVNSNSIVATGWFESNDYDLEGLLSVARDSNYDGIIAQYDYNGNLKWKKSIGGTRDEDLMDVAVINDDFAIVGYTDSKDGTFEGLFNQTMYSSDGFLYLFGDV